MRQVDLRVRVPRVKKKNRWGKKVYKFLLRMRGAIELFLQLSDWYLSDKEKGGKKYSFIRVLIHPHNTESLENRRNSVT